MTSLHLHLRLQFTLHLRHIKFLGLNRLFIRNHKIGTFNTPILKNKQIESFDISISDMHNI